MTSYPVPCDELTRLTTLRDYRLLDTPPDPRFDVFTRLAEGLYGCSAAVATLVDENRIWFKSRIGLPVGEIPRERAFCAYTIMSKEVLVVPDAAQDMRFKDNPLVTGDIAVRFYAGAPILGDNGHSIGTLAILDQKPRTLDRDAERRLADLANGLSSIIELHRANLNLHHAATHDQLTGLANRDLLFHRLVKALVAGDGRNCAVLAIDLDRFKMVNDSFGHSAGDAVLKEAAMRMLKVIRPGDLAARLGGDEFVIVLGSPVTEREAMGIAQRLLVSLERPMAIPFAMVEVGASIGLAMSQRDGDDPDGLLKAADLALYEAKRGGRGRVRQTVPTQAA